MATWTPTTIPVVIGGVTYHMRGLVSDDATPQLMLGTAIIGDDGIPIGSEDLGAGPGLYTVHVGKQEVGGELDEGDDLVDAKPLYEGGMAVSALATPVPLDDGQLIAQRFTRDGRMPIFPWTVPEEQLATDPVHLTGTTPVQVYPAITDMKYAIVGALIDNIGTVDTSVLFLGGSTARGRTGAPKRGVSPPSSMLPLQIRTAVNEILNLACTEAGADVWVTPFVYRTKL